MSQPSTSSSVLTPVLEAARRASLALATATTGQKNLGLHAIAVKLRNSADAIIAANQRDLANGAENGLST
ncbi:MAG: Gamma-glutamyl phosphate reductase, partial [Cryobacterium sp.]|nr:Gamma-glutamyl phosphate reductase [Cryobacterium sp.]